jgi:cell wall-associated NlpC family hydrolase
VNLVPGRVIRSCGALLVAASAALSLVVVSDAAQASPQQTERQLDAAWNKLEKVGETYKQNEAELRHSQRESAKLAAKIAPLKTKVDAMYRQVGKIAAAAYKGSNLQTVNSILSSGPGDILDQMSTLDQLAARQRHQVATYTKLKNSLTAKKATLDRTVAADKKKQASLTAQKASIQKQMARMQKQHVHEVATATGASYVPPYVPGPAGTVVRFAYAQLGKPYVWDTAGPDTYDCSGLTLAAWAQVGVHMAHYTVDQYNAFPKVNRSQLQPGDLVFWNNLQHEALYVGNGYAIHAPTPGEPVKLSTMSQLDYVGPYDGAVRPGPTA